MIIILFYSSSKGYLQVDIGLYPQRVGSLAGERVEERTQNTHPEPGHMSFVKSDETSIVQKLSH